MHTTASSKAGLRTLCPAEAIWICGTSSVGPAQYVLNPESPCRGPGRARPHDFVGPLQPPDRHCPPLQKGPSCSDSESQTQGLASRHSPTEDRDVSRWRPLVPAQLLRNPQRLNRTGGCVHRGRLPLLLMCPFSYPDGRRLSQTHFTVGSLSRPGSSPI